MTSLRDVLNVLIAIALLGFIGLSLGRLVLLFAQSQDWIG